MSEHRSATKSEPLPAADQPSPDKIGAEQKPGQTGTRIFVRDLELDGHIGVHAHERGRTQRLRINLELVVAAPPVPLDDRYENVVCYDEVVSAVRRLVAAGHVNLIETLAERIAALCLADPRVGRATVRVEKLDVYADAAAVGVEIERFKSPARTIISQLR
jgi:7,8-dihydroneopterin aldolase/epimerase/oxygenase